MIKILKWELLKELNILKLILIPFLTFLLILLLIPVKTNMETGSVYDIFLGFSSLIIMIISVFFIFLYPSISLILELRQPYSILESSIPQPFIKILIVRIIRNIFVSLIGILMGLIGMKVMNRFYIVPRIHFQYDLYLLLIMVIFYPLVIQFFYLLTSKLSPILGTIFLTILFIKVTTGFYFLPYIILMPAQMIITIIAFAGSCLLYEKYYIPK